jgi:CNT family concentrative nucleoside transporter
MFVLRTKVGYSIFNWFAIAASDLVNSGHAGAAFLFDADTVQNKHWPFVAVLPLIIWFVALVQMLHYVRASFHPGGHIIYITLVAWRHAMGH